MMTLVMMMAIAISAAAMPYNTARNEALFLSDKMAYELGLTATQYEAVYEINLDYLLNVDNRADVFGFWWDVRNRDLRLVLSTWQWERYMASTWFYRPLSWGTGGWTFSIYTRYATGRMFYHRPAVYVTFRGGHSHRGNSFYNAHRFDKPNPPKGHGNHNFNHNNYGNHNNGNWSHNGDHHGNGNHNPSVNHGGWNHNGNPNGNSNHNPSTNNGNWSHNGNGNHNPSTNNGNWSHNGNSNHNGNYNPSANSGNRHMTGSGNHNPSMGGSFGNNHRSGSANTPSRTFGTRPSGNMAGNGHIGNDAPRRTFGGGNRR